MSLFERTRALAGVSAAAALWLAMSVPAHACEPAQIAGAWTDADGLGWTFRLGAPGEGSFVDVGNGADSPFVRAFGEPMLWRVIGDGKIRVLTVPAGDYGVVGTPEVMYRCQISDGEMRWTNGNGPPVTFKAAASP